MCFEWYLTTHDDLEVLPESTPCPVLPLTSGQSYSLEYDIGIHWHWEFRAAMHGRAVILQHACPSLRQDSLVTVDGVAAGRSAGSLLSLSQTTEVLDCHGQRVFSWSSGGVMESIFYGLQASSRHVVYDPHNEPVAVIDGSHFFGNDLAIRDARNETLVVAHMARGFLSNWNLTVVDGSHRAANLVLLATIAGAEVMVGVCRC